MRITPCARWQQDDPICGHGRSRCCKALLSSGRGSAAIALPDMEYCSPCQFLNSRTGEGIRSTRQLYCMLSNEFAAILSDIHSHVSGFCNTNAKQQNAAVAFPTSPNVIAPCGEWVRLQVQFTSRKQEQPQTTRVLACLRLPKLGRSMKDVHIVAS
jgi:hypothetical protein